MEELIKKIRAVEPTTEQAKDRTPEYAFGWIDSLNAITEIVKNNVVLQNVMSRCISETVKKREDQILKVLEDNGYNLLKLRT